MHHIEAAKITPPGPTRASVPLLLNSSSSLPHHHELRVPMLMRRMRHLPRRQRRLMHLHRSRPSPARPVTTFRLCPAIGILMHRQLVERKSLRVATALLSDDGTIAFVCPSTAATPPIAANAERAKKTSRRFIFFMPPSYPDLPTPRQSHRHRHPINCHSERGATRRVEGPHISSLPLPLPLG